MPKDKSVKSSKKSKSSKVAAEPTAAAEEPSLDSDQPVASTSASAQSAPYPPPAPEPVEPSAEVVEPVEATEEAEPNLLEIDTTLPAPLSKAKARKAKAKGLPAPASVPSSSLPVASEDAETADGEAAAIKAKKEKAPERYSVWIGNLAFKTSEQQLREFLSSALKKGKQWGAKPAGEDGEEEAEKRDEPEEEATITRVNLPKTGGHGKFGVNKGFAYVDFSTREACLRAVKLSEGHLDGRALLIKLGSDFSSRPVTAASTALPEGKTKSRTVQALLAKQKQPPSSTLFVGNLGFEATEASLRNLIETHWSTSLSSSRHSSKPKKSSFRPEPTEVAAPVVATKDESSEDDSSDDEDATETKKSTAPPPPPPAEKAEVTDKDGKVQEIEVSGAGLRKVRVGQFQDTGKCKGFAFLDFHTSAQATAALIDMRNHRLDGRELKLEYASPAATARSGSGTQTFNNPATDLNNSTSSAAPINGESTSEAPAKVRPLPTPKTSTKKRLMKKERVAARIAAGLPPTVPVDAPNNPAPPPRNFGGERLKAKRARGEGEGEGEGEGAGLEGKEGEEKAERKKPKVMNKWEKMGRTAPGAALALAKREKVGIVASEGKKITFD